VTRRGSVTTSAGGEAAPERGMGEDDINWTNVNLIELKNKKNQHGRFNWYKWTVEI
jgi:hypothetical protein